LLLPARACNCSSAAAFSFLDLDLVIAASLAKAAEFSRPSSVANWEDRGICSGDVVAMLLSLTLEVGLDGCSDSARS
jgi:hypothetical protein